MAGTASSSDSLATSFPLLETADLFQELSLGSNGDEPTRNRYKGSLQHQYGHVPSGAFTAPSLHGSERRPNLPNGGDLFGSYPWGYYPSNHPSGGYQDQNFGYGHNSSSNTFSHLMNPHSSQDALSFDQFGYNDHMYSNNGLYGLYGNVIDSGHAYGTFGYDSWKLGRGWYPVDGYKKTRSFNYGRGGYSEEKADRLNELCRGPRSSDSKTPQGLNSTVEDLQRYNGESFPETFTKAKFFVIKSYSEDDVHNSIKYGVWSSTPTGNKKLNAAYQESSPDCPVYLLFSVNASGQFVGVAEMTGPVDFNKTMEYWQQDKWIGCFPVKWHIIKDVPNSLMRHITLANNENKPVTNSRDTQEVKLEDGTRIIKIFKEYMSKTCILDDFKFYETRQKIIRDKKIKQKKQVLDGASVETIH
ncbi:evolutionarily conserved C-terminal region 1 [Raphanus sativus]|uniref:YTH domain-containing family protein n=1 Tax=Raphanus sativus TaxID=3726 RepID=A0A6J0JW49_RAPSA|nr:YTH domain-containing protein ECT1 [Raphanus sativus]KAJ4886222.1 evolutionarily conserved C-terminal region 1 [Raphanus sativus]